jgi:phosphoserine phosphatase
VRFATVVFDCDSTLSTLEGIEELAADHRDEVTALTEAAMRGELPLEAVYGQRLALVGPSRQRVDALGPRYVETLVPDARATVARLRTEGLEVRVLSGGLEPPVLHLAAELGIPDRHVAAVPVRFDGDVYAGYDASSPLARAGGKRVVLERWRSAGMPGPVLLVGDGATDLEARPAVDLFVAYAGVVDRPAVTAAADVVIREPSLLAVVDIALGR